MRQREDDIHSLHGEEHERDESADGERDDAGMVSLQGGLPGKQSLDTHAEPRMVCTTLPPSHVAT